MNIDLIKENVIFPALMIIGKYSDDAADMVLVTGAVESHYRHVRQIGGGSALGLFQMEPSTHDDIWRNYLMSSRLRKVSDGLTQLTKRPGVYQELEVNPWYAAAMCRVHYLRDRHKLPKAGNRMAQAEYWKRVYNTVKGKGTVGKFLEDVTEILK